jgi:hypothetical protein
LEWTLLPLFQFNIAAFCEQGTRSAGTVAWKSLAIWKKYLATYSQQKRNHITVWIRELLSVSKAYPCPRPPKLYMYLRGYKQGLCYLQSFRLFHQDRHEEMTRQTSRDLSVLSIVSPETRSMTSPRHRAVVKGA